jgi:hypothetical protein
MKYTPPNAFKKPKETRTANHAPNATVHASRPPSGKGGGPGAGFDSVVSLSSVFSLPLRIGGECRSALTEESLGCCCCSGSAMEGVWPLWRWTEKGAEPRTRHDAAWHGLEKNSHDVEGSTRQSSDSEARRPKGLEQNRNPRRIVSSLTQNVVCLFLNRD